MIIGGQVLIAPAFAFAITYLIDIDTSTASLSIRLDLVPWILSAALAYGIISFILALVAGGFMPISVANSGGWMARLGLIDKFRDLMADHSYTRFGGGATFEYPAIRSLGFTNAFLPSLSVVLKIQIKIQKNMRMKFMIFKLNGNF